MYLLQAFDTAGFERIEQATFEEVVCFFATLTINRIVRINKPVQKVICPTIRVVFCQYAYAISIQNICLSLFAIRSLKFEVVSSTHDFNAFCTEFPFQPTPIVSRFNIIRFIVNRTHDIYRREKPLALGITPNSTHLFIIVKTYGLFICHINPFFLFPFGYWKNVCAPHCRPALPHSTFR